ncbi:ABC transporter ATP-binding protein [Magnetospira thiophila]
MISLIGRILSFIDPMHRAKIYILVALMGVTSLLDMAALGLILPILTLFTEPDRIYQWTGGLLRSLSHEGLILLSVGCFTIFFLIKTFATLLMVFFTNRISARMMAQFQTNVFRRYLRRPYILNLTSASSDVMHNTVMNCYRAFEAVRIILNIVLESMLATATALLLLLVEPLATCAMAVMFGATGFIYHRYAGPVLQRWGTIMVQSERNLLQASGQAFHSIKSIKIHQREAYFEAQFFNLAKTDSVYRSNAFTFQHVPRLAVELLMIMAFAVSVAVMVFSKSELSATLPVLGLFAMAALRLMPSLNRLLQAMGELRQREPAINLVHAELAASARETARPSEQGQSSRPLPFERDLTLENLTFHYTDQDAAALRDICLTVHKGESIGLVGGSGAGKSTLTEIILGLIRPSAGSIKVDGKDIWSAAESWNMQLGFVPQHIYILDDTLRNNIAFGVAAENIDEERVRKSVSMAYLDSVVAGLPEGLDTLVGENGVRLSGGQRQRLGIARALYTDPALIVLDEATSALDNETELEVNAAIDRLAGKKTMIIVAHRLSTVRHCQRIVFMRDGSIEAIGSFQDLMEKSPGFRRLVELGGQGELTESQVN